MSNLSLISIIREDPEFGKRISKKVIEIKQDKKNLLNIADEYGSKYKQEILEGTERRAKLLTEGKSRGLTEEEVMQEYGRFLPSIKTPILNLLYYLLKESEDDCFYGKNHYREKDKLNERFGHLREEELKQEIMGDAPQMMEFLYGNLTLEQFEILKKLKAMTQSDNIEEATLAFKKGKELCHKYDLDWE
jgi:hypothetical protein